LRSLALLLLARASFSIAYFLFLLEICPFFVTLIQWIKPSKKGAGRCRFASKGTPNLKSSPPKSSTPPTSSYQGRGKKYTTNRPACTFYSVSHSCCEGECESGKLCKRPDLTRKHWPYASECITGIENMLDCEQSPAQAPWESIMREQPDWSIAQVPLCRILFCLSESEAIGTVC
jgi:hypothetical protein